MVCSAARAYSRARVGLAYVMNAGQTQMRTRTIGVSEYGRMRRTRGGRLTWGRCRTQARFNLPRMDALTRRSPVGGPRPRPSRREAVLREDQGGAGCGSTVARWKGRRRGFKNRCSENVHRPCVAYVAGVPTGEVPAIA